MRLPQAPAKHQQRWRATATEQSRAEQSRAEQSRAEQSRAEQSRAEQSRAEQSRAESTVFMTKNLRKKRKLTDFGLCITSAEAKAELEVLFIMAQDQNYRRLSRGIEKGYVKISNNPALKYEMIRDRSDMTFVHDYYWKALKASAAWIEENLPDECTSD